MGNQMKGLLYYFTTQAKRSLYIFWSILGVSLLVSFIIAMILDRTQVGEAEFFFMLSFAVYVFSAFYGFISVRYELPFSIKMGATRKHFWLSRFIFFIGLTICQVIIIQLVTSLSKLCRDLLNMETNAFQLAHPAILLDNTFFQQIVIDATLIFSITAIFYLLGMLYYKYGLIGIAALAAVVLIFLLFAFAKGWFYDVYIYLDDHFSLNIFYYILLAGILCYLLSWLLIRRATTEATR